LDSLVFQTGPSDFCGFKAEEGFKYHCARDGSNTSLVSSRANTKPEEEDPTDEGVEDEGRGSREGKRRSSETGMSSSAESLKSIKGKVIADFIVEHSINRNNDESYNFVSIRPWKFFAGSACKEGQCVGIVLILSRGVVFEQSVHLDYFCTNNQAEYDHYVRPGSF
jgi:hypothetical protein